MYFETRSARNTTSVDSEQRNLSMVLLIILNCIGLYPNGTKKRYSPCYDWNKPLGWETILGGLPPPVALIEAEPLLNTFPA